MNATTTRISAATILIGALAAAAPAHAVVFSYTGAAQTFDVTTTGDYFITAYGASGGGGAGAGGLGAEIGVEATLEAGDVLTVLVGGRGGDSVFDEGVPFGSDTGGGGGGGATAVVLNSNILVFAGGGGGGGVGGGFGRSGGDGLPFEAGTGGGGAGCVGGGFTGGFIPGLPASNGLVGQAHSASGGGAAAGSRGSIGGGGNGGSCGAPSTPPFPFDIAFGPGFTGGLGGYSFFDNSLEFVSSGGENLGSGLVIISVPEPSTWALMLIGFGGLGFAAFRRARAEPRPIA